MGGSGGLPLEVLYEDPKEDLQSDVLSILSSTEINDDDKKKLIEEIRESSGNNTSTDQTNPKPNINMRLNTKSIFSRFTSSNNANGLNNDDFFRGRGLKKFEWLKIFTLYAKPIGQHHCTHLHRCT